MALHNRNTELNTAGAKHSSQNLLP